MPFSFIVLKAESCISVITNISAIGIMNKIDNPTLSRRSSKVSFLTVANSFIIISLSVYGWLNLKKHFRDLLSLHYLLSIRRVFLQLKFFPDQ